MRPSNDDICMLFDWLYLGGERNIRKTLPHVTVWYDFRHNTSYPKNLRIPDTVHYIHYPFDDGDLQQGIVVWEKVFNEIQEHKNNNEKIFVSCTEGVSRSAVLALWLVAHELKDYNKALQYVKTKRNIFPDKNFSPFLLTLQSKYMV